MLALRVVNPERGVLERHRRDERAAVWRHCYAFLLGGPGSDLFRLAIGKTLPPDVIASAGIGSKKHPLAVVGPCCHRAAGPERSYMPAPRTAVHWNQAARQPVVVLVHFYQQRPFSIW